MLESQVYPGVPASPVVEQPSDEPKIEVEEMGEDCARIVAAPLAYGFGITLGNALRRVLLSSLPGAAVTSVRIDGVLHEFSTIPNVKEDTIEFLLNVKELRLRALSDRPGTLILDISGREGEITAADLQVPEHYEVINPDLHLVTMDSPKGQLHVELNVEPGQGYMPAGQVDGLPIGVIPLDAVFSPVRKVNYKVSRTRVGQETNYDRLEMEVWTDGTISAVDAVSRSAEILSEQFTLFAHMGQPPLPVVERGLGAGVVLTPEKYNMPIEDLNLSMRAYNCLRRSGLMAVGQVLEKSEEELLSLRNFGRKSYDELRNKLNELGLLPAEQPEEVMEAPPLEEGEVPILAQQPPVEEAEAAPAVEEAKVEEEAPAPAAGGREEKKAEPGDEEEIPEWKRKLMEITGEEAGE
ncbi:MAG: DNA-directed RNA polymerase subunit alpha [Dehalococcoidia bacterium]|nr:MAG: DNA-directed RNA polymerase subunit alpha [Dehalococcoidia bacterium]